MQTKRRTLVKQFLNLPIVASIFKFSSFQSKPLPDSETRRRQAEFLAVSIVRLINTAQAWHFESFGHYTDLETLRNSEAMSKLLRSERAEKHGIGRSLHSKLRFDMPEIVPGWKLKFTLGENQNSYAATLSDISGEKMGSFTSDDSGIISASDPLAIMNAKQTQTPRRRLMSLVGSIIFGPLAVPQSSCTCPYGFCTECFLFCDEYCCPSQSCRKIFFSGCFSCGCVSCIWCC